MQSRRAITAMNKMSSTRSSLTSSQESVALAHLRRTTKDATDSFMLMIDVRGAEPFLLLRCDAKNPANTREGARNSNVSLYRVSLMLVSHLV
eukprot:scaffold19285_cov80-Skeletonema_marinoi.AAC.2